MHNILVTIHGLIIQGGAQHLFAGRHLGRSMALLPMSFVGCRWPGQFRLGVLCGLV